MNIYKIWYKQQYLYLLSSSNSLIHCSLLRNPTFCSTQKKCPNITTSTHRRHLAATRCYNSHGSKHINRTENDQYKQIGGKGNHKGE